ncbi:MAG: DUF2269 family protein [Candidatus Accumulibacter sp.]|jgi:hypothetical protein|nr:DUF2269 family protein [Accumulibacter sp.]
MKKLSGQGYKIIKTIHILSASIWIGAGVVVLFMLSVVLNRNNMPEILLAIHYVDLLIIIPSNLLTFVTGMVFSKFSGWGFFRHRWIMAKYAINFVPVILGGIILAPSMLDMLSIIEKTGEGAIFDPRFIESRNRLMGAFVIILVLLIMAVCLTVVKPGLGKKVINK